MVTSGIVGSPLESKIQDNTDELQNPSVWTVGRLIDYLEQSGQLENTVVLYAADNGASGEGGPNGSVNENKFFNGYPESENLKLLNVLGGPDTYEHYPTGWAVATSTPFKMFKRYYVYNFLGIKPEQKFVSSELKPGKYSLGVEFTRQGAGQYHESLGTTNLYVNDKIVATGPMRTQPGKFTLSGDGLCIGNDSGDAVSQGSKTPGKFTGGTILFVGVSVEKAQSLDLETLAAAAFAAD